MKLKVKDLSKKIFSVEELSGLSFINGIPQYSTIIQYDSNRYSAYQISRVFHIQVISSDQDHVTLRVNGYLLTVQLQKPDFSFLTGVDINPLGKKMESTLRAPMPGIITEIRFQEGHLVAAGDVLLVLEAMKMENTIKATSAGYIKKIHVERLQKVEKNQILISF